MLGVPQIPGDHLVRLGGIQRDDIVGPDAPAKGSQVRDDLAPQCSSGAGNQDIHGARRYSRR
jgi:hypothetical protein